MKNPERPVPVIGNGGSFYKTGDGTNIFIYDYKPGGEYKSTLFLVSGITGINHRAELDIIEQLSNAENRVVVIHPRGTGYSEGKRGDIPDFSDFINDYIEIITSDKDYHSKQHKVILYGHSMSTAVLLAITERVDNIEGVILVNPPYRMKKAEGMTPGVGEYMKYAGYYLFAKHKPIVDMAGNPAKIENEEDRRESESRNKDSMLVKYFSLYMMGRSGKLINSMIETCKKAKCPLLLIYGLNDRIVDKKGCELIFKEWNHEKKQFSLIENGSHGKSSVRLAKDVINKWISEL